MKTAVTAIVVAVPAFFVAFACAAKVVAQSDRIEELELNLRLTETKLKVTTRNLDRANSLMTLPQLAKMLEGAALDMQFHSITRDI